VSLFEAIRTFSGKVGIGFPSENATTQKKSRIQLPDTNLVPRHSDFDRLNPEKLIPPPKGRAIANARLDGSSYPSPEGGGWHRRPSAAVLGTKNADAKRRLCEHSEAGRVGVLL